ncbi:MAG TPA: peptidase S10 [Gammaproteobacteria bacterium]|nr:peptidase S10 [Gammaproteobacteria bacterium]
MNRFSLPLAASALFLVAASALAAGGPPPGTHGAPASAPASPTQAQKQETHGSVTINGKAIAYDAYAGTLILKNDDQKPIASMSYFAYLKSGVKDPTTRPITFFYNGGPGSSTVWLHMLAFGPKRVVVGNGTLTPPAPYRMVNNDQSLLDATDEVFIDAPGTGFGRVLGKEQGGAGSPSDVYGIDADAQAFDQFIVQFLTEYNRWNSPKFLFGESYGTTRDAVLAYDLEQDNVGLNGVVFLSSILNWSISVDFPQVNPGINISYELGLPSYAATAWYHNKLPHKPADLNAFLKQCERFALGPYAQALDRGDQLDAASKQKIAEALHYYTGLPVAYLLKADLKVSGGQFAHELLGDDDRITGRLDSRFSGPTMDPLGEEAQYDPLDAAIDAPTVSMFNQYVRNTLKFGQNLTYKPQINVFPMWDFKHQPPGAPFALPFTPNVMPDLAAAMKFNPNMKIMLAGGYFDLGTPFYGAIYEMHQLGIPPSLQKNIRYDFFPSGHMVYLNPAAHKGLRDATATFIEQNSGNQPQPQPQPKSQ